MSLLQGLCSYKEGDRKKRVGFVKQCTDFFPTEIHVISSSPQAAVAELCQITETMRVLFRSFSSTCTKKQISTRAIELADITVNAHDTIGWGDPVYIRQFLHVSQC